MEQADYEYFYKYCIPAFIDYYANQEMLKAKSPLTDEDYVNNKFTDLSNILNKFLYTYYDKNHLFSKTDFNLDKHNNRTIYQRCCSLVNNNTLQYVSNLRQFMVEAIIYDVLELLSKLGNQEIQMILKETK